MQYEELTEGDQDAELEFQNISPEHMHVVSAIMRDPNPIHFDRRHTEEMDRPGLINQGPINVSYISQVALKATEDPTALRHLNVRNEVNVFEGEDVRAIATVSDKYTEDGDPLVELDIELRKPDGTVAVVGDAVVTAPD
jgi:acyl dehydratase